VNYIFVIQGDSRCVANALATFKKTQRPEILHFSGLEWSVAPIEIK